MKIINRLLLLLLIAIPSVGMAQEQAKPKLSGVEELTISDFKSGTLRECVGGNFYFVKRLTILGYLDKTDFKFLKELCNRKVCWKGTQDHDTENVLELDVSRVNYDSYDKETLAGSVALKGIMLGSLSMRDNLLRDCKKLEWVEMSEGFTSLGDNCFRGCKNLKQFTVIDKRKGWTYSIGKNAFEGCSQLKSVKLINGLREIKDEAFSGTGITEIRLPEGLTEMGSSVFKDTQVRELMLPGSLRKVSARVFQGSMVGRILVSSDNVSLRAINGMLFDKRGWVLEAVPPMLNEISLPGTLRVISDYAFMNHQHVGKLNIPESVYYLGKYAFSGSTLSEIKLPSGLKDLKEGAFSGCRNLSTITIPAGIDSLAMNLFEDCSSLSSVSLPTSIHSIGRRTFDGCRSLKDIDLPRGLTSIANLAFSNSGIKHIRFPQSLSKLGNSMFAGCQSLDSLQLPPGVIHIPEFAFSTIPGLKYVKMSDNTESIGIYAFNDCHQLEQIDLSANLRVIKFFAFRNCYHLQKVDIPGKVVEIGEKAFEECKDLVEVNLPASLQLIGKQAFHYTGLRELRIPSEQTKLESGILNHCDHLEAVHVPYLNPEKVGRLTKNKETILYVPQGTAEKYKTVKGWKNFKKIEEE